MAFICLWSQLDEKWTGSTHYDINVEVAGSACPTVKAAKVLLKEHRQSVAYGNYCTRLINVGFICLWIQFDEK